MFRLISVMLAIGVGLFQAIYGKNKEILPPAQTNNQPIVKKKQEITKLTPKPLPSEKPAVIFGSELTEEEWVWIQNVPQDRN